MTQQAMSQELVDRIAKLADPVHFRVGVILSPELVAGLSTEELTRLERKLGMVRSIAAKLAANMVKGTLKYPHDGWPLRTWLEFGLDDAVDSVNYFTLAIDEFDRGEYGPSS